MKSASLKSKVLSVGYIMLAAYLVVFVVAGYTVKEARLSNRLANDYAEVLRSANRVDAEIGAYQSALRGFLIDPNRKDLRAEVDKKIALAEEKAVEAMSRSTDVELNELMRRVVTFVKESKTLEKQMFFLISTNREKGLEYFNHTYIPAFEKLGPVITEARKSSVNLRDMYRASFEQHFASSVIIVFGSMVGLLVFMFIYTRVIAGSLSNALSKVSEAIATTATSVRNASAQVSQASQGLSESTTQQASAIEETVSSMEEIGSMLSQTTQNASLALTVSDEGKREAEKAEEVVNKLIAAMDEIQGSNARLQTLVKLIEEIKSKTRVINEIVSETRLLSFNASIEAARAGVHGKGFAVVAEEVGKLASMSGKAAEEIRNLLESGTAEVTQVVKSTQERVTSGKEVSQDCAEAFHSMGRSLEKIGESVRLITTAAKEQESGVEQTNKAMSEMDQVTQKNAAASDDLASQSSELSTGAENLLISIQQLRKVVFGSDSAVETKKSPPSLIAKVEKISAPRGSKPKLAIVPAREPLERSVHTAPESPLTKTEASTEIKRSDSRWKVG